MSPTAVIADDEPLVRQEIRLLLKELWPELVVHAEVGDGIAALAALEAHAPDVLFLDMQMPGLTGLDVAQRVQGRAHVVFISASDEYAVAAFEQGALDYVLKPVSAARLALTIERLRSRLTSPPANLSGVGELLKQLARAEFRYFKWLTVPHDQEYRVIAVGELLYLRADHKYTEIVTPAASYIISTPLKRMRERLDPEVFWQIHRGVMINVAAIDSVRRTLRGSLEVKVRHRTELLPVSAAYTHRFRMPA
ncbi:MAG: LytTR family DNA-binding domain-containing protein [Deltaproteobacteria bacterium]